MDSLGLRGRFRLKETCRAVFVKGWLSAQQEQQCLASIRNANSTDSEGSPGGSELKNLPDNAGDVGFIPGVRKIPWRRKWQHTPVFLPEKSHGQRSLAGYSPWGHKESAQLRD